MRGDPLPNPGSSAIFFDMDPKLLPGHSLAQLTDEKARALFPFG
jgi:hypothetical protein